MSFDHLIVWTHGHKKDQRDTSSCALSISCWFFLMTVLYTSAVCAPIVVGLPASAVPVLIFWLAIVVFRVFSDTFYLNLQPELRIKPEDGCRFDSVGPASDSHHNWDRFAQIPLRLPSSHTYACSDKTLSPETFRPRMCWPEQGTGQNSHERFCLGINWDLATSWFPSKLLEHFTCKLSSLWLKVFQELLTIVPVRLWDITALWSSRWLPCSVSTLVFSFFSISASAWFL